MNSIVTAQQRLSVYHNALDSLIAENNYYRCMCSLLQRALGELYGYKYVLLQHLYTLPEFEVQRPEKMLYNSEIWFEVGTEHGFKQRIRVLQNCIDEIRKNKGHKSQCYDS